jgi:HK97 family phage major capsid protein/HK97 family phage prohead protease
MTTIDLRGQTVTREMRIEARAVDDDVLELAFSSELPVERWFGREILDHSPKAMRGTRLNDGAPLLLQHDPDRQIGVIESARSDNDRIGRARVRFSQGPLGREIRQDVLDGIRSKVSVGYVIHDMQRESQGDEDTYRVTDWEPLEISIVSIPADSSVGVGRSIQPEVHAMADKANETPVERDEPIEPTAAKTETREQDPPKLDNPEAEAIRACGRHFRMAELAEDHIMLGGTLDEFRAKIRKQQPDPVPVAPRIESRIPAVNVARLRAFKPSVYGSVERAQEQAFRAGQWARAVVARDPEALRWCRDYGVRVMTGLGAGESAVVPEEMSLPIIDLREQYGVARRLCYVEPMGSDATTVPRRVSGVTAYFVGREDATTASDAAFDNISLTAREVSALTRISNSYLADSAINLADHLANEMAYAFAVKEDACLINGDGTNTYGGIIGLRTLLSAAGALAGAVDAATNNDTFGEITATDLRKVMGTLPDFPGINPVWLVSKSGANNLFGRLTDAAGGNTKRDVAQMMPEQYGGYDIVTSGAMPTTTGDLSDVVMAIFGDLRMGVTMGSRETIEISVLTERYAEYRQTGIIATERFDINCHGVGDGSNAGPIVALVGE